MTIRRVDLIRDGVFQNGPKRADSILPADFFSFGVGAAGIINGNFKYSRASFSQLDGEFRLDVKGLAFQRNAFQ